LVIYKEVTGVRHELLTELNERQIKRTRLKHGSEHISSPGTHNFCSWNNIVRVMLRYIMLRYVMLWYDILQ